jgi:hypothetical protein
LHQTTNNDNNNNTHHQRTVDELAERAVEAAAARTVPHGPAHRLADRVPVRVALVCVFVWFGLI